MLDLLSVFLKITLEIKILMTKSNEYEVKDLVGICFYKEFPEISWFNGSLAQKVIAH